MSFVDVLAISEEEKIPGYWLRPVHSNKMTLAFWRIAADAPLPKHSHPNEQIACVTEGRFELTVAGATRVLEPGMLAVIPPNTPHSGRGVTDCRLLDIFSPPREDLRRE